MDTLHGYQLWTYHLEPTDSEQSNIDNKALFVQFSENIFVITINTIL